MISVSKTFAGAKVQQKNDICKKKSDFFALFLFIGALRRLE
jgi:hypothetical protein